MALSPAVPRRPIHTRRIVCEGFEREDGLYDIDARIVDTKSFDYDHSKRGPMPAGTHVHDMQVRLTVGTDRIVRGIEVVTSSAPYDACFTAAPAYQALVGANIGSGWRRSVNEAVGGVKACTHLRELLMPVATVAFQTMEGGQKGVRRAMVVDDDTPKPFFMNQCKAWSEQGPLVKELFPRYYIQPVD